MFFTINKEIAQLRKDLQILAGRVEAYAKVVAEILDALKEINEAPHGYKKDGTAKKKPGRKVEE
jgi:hypothetical protein